MIKMKNTLQNSTKISVYSIQRFSTCMQIQTFREKL